MVEIAKIRLTKKGQKLITIPNKINLGKQDFLVFHQDEKGNIKVSVNGW